MRAINVTSAKLSILAAKAEPIIMASGHYKSIDELREDLEWRHTSLLGSVAAKKASLYLIMIESALTVTTRTAPTQETADWSCGFEGGHVFHDTRNGEAMARRIAAECGIQLRG